MTRPASTVKEVREWLEAMPDDALFFVYEGEMTGIVLRSSDGGVIGYLSAAECDLHPATLQLIRDHIQEATDG